MDTLTDDLLHFLRAHLDQFSNDSFACVNQYFYEKACEEDHYNEEFVNVKFPIFYDPIEKGRRAEVTFFQARCLAGNHRNLIDYAQLKRIRPIVCIPTRAYEFLRQSVEEGDFSIRDSYVFGCINDNEAPPRVVHYLLMKAIEARHEKIIAPDGSVIWHSLDKATRNAFTSRERYEPLVTFFKTRPTPFSSLARARSYPFSVEKLRTFIKKMLHTAFNRGRLDTVEWIFKEGIRILGDKFKKLANDDDELYLLRFREDRAQTDLASIIRFLLENGYCNWDDTTVLESICLSSNVAAELAVYDAYPNMFTKSSDPPLVFLYHSLPLDHLTLESYKTLTRRLKGMVCDEDYAAMVRGIDYRVIGHACNVLREYKLLEHILEKEEEENLGDWPHCFFSRWTPPRGQHMKYLKLLLSKGYRQWETFRDNTQMHMGKKYFTSSSKTLRDVYYFLSRAGVRDEGLKRAMLRQEYRPCLCRCDCPSDSE